MQLAPTTLLQKNMVSCNLERGHGLKALVTVFGLLLVCTGYKLASSEHMRSSSLRLWLLANPQDQTQGEKTHLPYTTTPPSFFASSYYQKACPQNNVTAAICNVEVAGNCSIASQPACTPSMLQQWDGKGAWYLTHDGHYRYHQESCY